VKKKVVYIQVHVPEDAEVQGYVIIYTQPPLMLHASFRSHHCEPEMVKLLKRAAQLALDNSDGWLGEEEKG
jgi:hypothetical protein